MRAPLCQDAGTLIRSGAAAAPEALAASVAQSSTLQRASEASSLNPLNVYVVVSSNNNVAGGQTKDITPTIDNSSNNHNVIVSKDGLESNSSVNKTGECNEASANEGTSVPVVGAEVNPAENAYGVGEAVATVLLQRIYTRRSGIEDQNRILLVALEDQAAALPLRWEMVG